MRHIGAISVDLDRVCAGKVIKIWHKWVTVFT